MCGSQPAVLFRPNPINADGIVQGFGAVLSTSREVIAVSPPRQVGRGYHRGEAVAAYLRAHNRALVRDYEEYSALGLPGVALPLQAGAAATQLVADVLDALMADNLCAVKVLIEEFVNDAVDTGVVTL